MPTIADDFDHAVSASVLSDGRVVLYERPDRARELAAVRTIVECLISDAADRDRVIDALDRTD